MGEVSTDWTAITSTVDRDARELFRRGDAWHEYLECRQKGFPCPFYFHKNYPNVSDSFASRVKHLYLHVSAFSGEREGERSQLKITRGGMTRQEFGVIAWKWFPFYRLLAWIRNETMMAEVDLQANWIREFSNKISSERARIERLCFCFESKSVQ